MGRGHEFNAMLKWPLEKKVEQSMDWIAEVFDLFDKKKVSVACSFGKDSMVLLALVRKLYPGVLVAFGNTNVQDPRQYALRDQVVKDWNLNFMQFDPPPGVTYWTLAEKYGFPKAVRTNTREPKCCKYLKTDPQKKFIRETGLNTIFVGSTGDEGRHRRLNYFRQGHLYHARSWRCWKATPLIFWTEQDIWEYIWSNDIPWCEAYNDVPRLGCVPCTGYLDWKKQMAKQNPKMCRVVLHKMGQNQLDDYVPVSKGGLCG